MTETLTPPVTGSPLAVLFDIVAASARLTLEEERDGAETAAADHVYAVYPDTLGRVVDHDAWTGYPALRDNSVQPSAVAHLGGGLWLHHTITDDADYRDVLTLLVPCTLPLRLRPLAHRGRERPPGAPPGAAPHRRARCPPW